MNFEITNTFITEDFLLETSIAKKLYYDYAKAMPIIDYHNHLSPQRIFSNIPFKNLYEAWLAEDHYKWRGMRANGIDEKYITGSASDSVKFKKWAETVPYTAGNPLFHWTHLELKRYFNIDKILQPNTAVEIYDTANEILQNKTPQQLLTDMNVEVVCTTDDPTNDLRYHQQIAKTNSKTKVFPTFRSDNLFLIEQDNFHHYLNKLSSTVDFSITNFEDFLNSIDNRIDFFHENGCRLSDFGVGASMHIVDYTIEKVNSIFKKRLEDKELSPQEINTYKSCLFNHLGRRYHEKKWVQQYHLGAIRNNNSRLLKEVGADVGCDSIGDYNFAEPMAKLFGNLDYENKLAKTITYNLNPSQNEVFATMMGNFNTGGIPGKMQWGSGWWYLDQKDGMEKQLTTLSNIGLLSRFVGMLTDSRSLLSFPRHEYFRRILCNFLGNIITKGELPNDVVFFGKMVQDISYNNAKKYFDFDS
ncbi:glucuronate isomerase [Polaribacter batillariae]|uniref:Uronate isomerase n=1 Tax=Polaribacter batillariae TaxID=2808900 RepID=A0ABX7SW40_9FLAO|nr:glucuronate isomerase [Polaribacter batillariae]QTD38469.1 glucuronate isomerase [Polaribacter batillariae]